MRAFLTRELKWFSTSSAIGALFVLLVSLLDRAPRPDEWRDIIIGAVSIPWIAMSAGRAAVWSLQTPLRRADTLLVLGVAFCAYGAAGILAQRNEDVDRYVFTAGSMLAVAAFLAHRRRHSTDSEPQ
jgi:hypothetical protein